MDEMQAQPIPRPEDEAERLVALQSYHVLDTEVETDFDLLTELAAVACQAPYAFLSLVDAERVWYKSVHGRSGTQAPRDLDYCAWAVLEQEGLYIPDLSRDPRTARLPRTVGEPGYRSYYAANLLTPEGHCIGTLCVLDTRAHRITGDQQRLVRGLARQVMVLLQLRRRQHDLRSMLEAARAEAQALSDTNRELDAFGYSVSHDLRAPLRAVRGFSEILSEEFRHLMPAEAARHLDRVREASRHLDELVNGLLALSRIGRTGVERGWVDVSAIAHSVMRDLQAQDPAREHEIHIDDGLFVPGDSRMLRSVLQNLLGNAWKYSALRVRTEICLCAVRHGEDTVFVVKDNGVGFDMKAASRLFRPFQRLHDAASFHGIGIGLATAGRIVQLHGGRIWAESAEGEGAKFYLLLPGAQASALRCCVS